MAISTLKVDLPAEIFDVELNVPLIHQVVVAQQAAARQGTASTKTRGEVRGGGKKPYKQKGTGRARQGSTRAPQFAGGGVVHGPQPRDYSQRTPKKMKAAALKQALSDRARAGQVHVAEFSFDVPKTKDALVALKQIADAKRYLVVLDRAESNAALSLRNAPEVHLLWFDQLNTYDVLLADDVVFSKAAYDAFVSGTPVAQAIEAEVDLDKNEAEEPVEKPAAPAIEVPEGAALPLEDGSAPEGYEIKGNITGKEKKFHAPGGRWYAATKPELWFKTAEDAIAAGFYEAGKKAATQKEADK